ncbi:hypothetical protein XAC3810_410013 [Xanthomonas citri pv. citri]|uniref:Uncharacterized protein n=1 Tax=Xanthomonas citri pv. citri TaxID=611301 RepID=A0A0U5BTA8_XANCI|nr:hypothetical protein HZS92_02390 [Xanthomonas citri pv. citri]CEE26831.1 hypothetical protein XAC9322_430013 [Xanthomonas citri pv. citri]CEE28401.1 hypothetical protein XAC1083_430013 [Xanthomonas citri pv. citri]CEE37475.1 hypothetical protein XAC3810_410013 [Xanthomonas citri pv. citri]CEE40340.1 hypothetical protein XAC2911_400013 [Xanthomonas citri pv. citri]
MGGWVGVFSLLVLVFAVTLLDFGLQAGRSPRFTIWWTRRCIGRPRARHMHRVSATTRSTGQAACPTSS